MSDEPNRYAAPTAELSPQLASAAEGEFVPAGRWRRFLNFVLDYAAFMFAAFVVGLVMGITGIGMGVFNSGKLAEFTFSMVVFLLYYIATEGAFGRTFGKVLTRTHVVTDSGARPGLGQVAIRSLIRLVPFEFFSAFRKDALMWHDSVSGTRVVTRRG